VQKAPLMAITRRKQFAEALRKALAEASSATDAFVEESKRRGAWFSSDRRELFELGYLRASIEGLAERLEAEDASGRTERRR
jgi:hypothetical protein